MKKISFSTFDTITKNRATYNMFADQIECCDKNETKSIDASFLKQQLKGKIYYPTGGGKTIIQAEDFARSMIRNNKLGNYILTCHRVLLLSQNMIEIAQFIASREIDGVKANVDPMFLFVYSGEEKQAKKKIETILKDNKFNIGSGADYHSVRLATTISEIENAVKEAERVKRPLLIGVVNRSFHKIIKMNLQVNLQINDEAHTLVSKTGAKIANYSGSKVILNYTATGTKTDSTIGKGTNNEYTFGSLFFKRKPKELIEEYRIVKPILGFTDAKGFNLKINEDQIITEDDEGNEVEETLIEGEDDKEITESINDNINPQDQANAILQIFEDSKKHLTERNGNKPTGNKLLTAIRGVKNIKEIYESTTLIKEAIAKNIKVFIITASTGALISHGKDGKSCCSKNTDSKDIDALLPMKVSRKEFIDLMSTDYLKDNDDAIFIQCRILIEGINLPLMTSIAPLRNMDRISLKQFIGRGLRPHPVDRKYSTNCFDNNLVVDTNRFIKPFCMVVLPVYDKECNDFNDEAWKVINELKEEYGLKYKYEDMVFLTDNIANVENKELEDPNDQQNTKFRNKKATAGEFFTEWEEKEKEIAKRNAEEQIRIEKEAAIEKAIEAKKDEEFKKEKEVASVVKTAFNGRRGLPFKKVNT